SPPVAEPAPVSLLAGTAERLARIAPIGDPELAPGKSAFARIHLSAPMALLPGDRFVLRGFARAAIGATLGGGTVLDISPPARRRSDRELVDDLDALARRDAEADVRVRVRRAGLAGITRAVLARDTGRIAEEIGTAVEGERSRGAVETAGERVVHAGALARI